MLVFNCTKAAAEFFTSTEKGQKISPIEAAPHKTIAESIANKILPDDVVAIDGCEVKQWHWLVHAIKVKRKNVLIVMDYHSRFSMTFSGLTKGNEYAFLNQLEHHLNVHVHEVMSLVVDDSRDIDQSLMHYNNEHDSCGFHLRGDRSVQSTLNDVVWHFKQSVNEIGSVPEGIDLIGFDAYINHQLRKQKGKKDYFYPQHQFLHDWLTQYGQVTTTEADQRVEQLKARELAEYQAQDNIMQTLVDEQLSAQKIDQTSDLSNVVFLDAFKKPH